MNPLAEIDATITAMWPASTPDKIAEALKLERSTVMRRANAIGLPPKVKPLAAPRVVKPRPEQTISGGNLQRKLDARAEDAPRLEYAPLPPVHPPGPNARIMADAPKRGCMFPVGDMPEGRADLQLFCCEPVDAVGCPYCAPHAAVAYYRKKGTAR